MQWMLWSSLLHLNTSDFKRIIIWIYCTTSLTWKKGMERQQKNTFPSSLPFWMWHTTKLLAWQHILILHIYMGIIYHIFMLQSWPMFPSCKTSKVSGRSFITKDALFPLSYVLRIIRQNRDINSNGNKTSLIICCWWNFVICRDPKKLWLASER